MDFTSKSIELESLEVGKTCLKKKKLQIIYRHGKVENLYIEMRERGQVIGILTQLT